MGRGTDRLVVRFGARFVRSKARQRAKAYLQGLLSPAECKNGWQLAEMLGEPTPYGIQQFLGRGVWDADECSTSIAPSGHPVSFATSLHWR